MLREAWVHWYSSIIHQPPGSAWMPGCVFHQITGLYCTGCGITRATYAVLQGDLARAWSMNPLAMMAGPVGLGLWIHEGLGKPQRWERVAARLRDARLWMFVVLAFTVARNLPWPPFAWLAPG